MNLINKLNVKLTLSFRSWELWSAMLMYIITLIDFSPILIMITFLVPFIIYFKNQKVNLIGSIKDVLLSNKNLIILVVIFFFSLINSIVHHFNEGILSTLKGPFITLPLIWICSYIINKKILKYLIFFTLLECIICIIQYMLGKTSFYTWISRYELFKSYELFAVTRVCGLGYTPSILSEKFFISILLIDFFDLKNKKSFLFKLLLYFGLIFTFTRTVLIGFYLYLFIQLILILYKGKFSFREKLFSYNIVFILIVYTSSFSNLTYFNKQFTRGGLIEKTSGKILTNSKNKIISESVQIPINNTDIRKNTTSLKVKNKKTSEDQEIIKTLKLNKIEMSGRSEIWSRYLIFIKNNLSFGNGSKSLKFGRYHAHNSYLALISANGCFISVLYLIFILLNINKKNFLFLFGIFTMGFGQYAFFWPISYVDLVLYAILLNSTQILD